MKGRQQSPFETLLVLVLDVDDSLRTKKKYNLGIGFVFLVCQRGITFLDFSFDGRSMYDDPVSGLYSAMFKNTCRIRDRLQPDPFET